MRPVIVGSRELKTRLGTYLRRVRSGERIVVSDRGQPIAELRGLRDGDASLDAKLVRLEVAGLVSRPLEALGPLRAIRSKGESLADAVLEDREDRL